MPNRWIPRALLLGALLSTPCFAADGDLDPAFGVDGVAYLPLDGIEGHELRSHAVIALPDDKLLAPGLIDTCSNYVEHPELIAQRIERYARIVGKDRVIASTDCGFGTCAGYGKIDPDVTWKKLRALREGADLADARL